MILPSRITCEEKDAVEISWHPVTRNVLVGYNGQGFAVTLACLEDSVGPPPNFASNLHAMGVTDAYVHADYFWELCHRVVPEDIYNHLFLNDQTNKPPASAGSVYQTQEADEI